MRRVRYQVAVSLDGYIAGPNGEADWIVMDPEIDFNAIFAQFDTILVGRTTYLGMVGQGNASMPGMKVFVFSTTLKQADYPDVTIVPDAPARTVAALKKETGKDIWLFGGGRLFRSLAESGLVDTVEPAIVPVLLGGGIPFLPSPAPRVKLALTGQRTYRTSGIVLLEYAVKASSRDRSPRAGG